MRLVTPILAVVTLCTASAATAERLPVSVSGGVGSRHFEDSGTEMIAPVQLRMDVTPRWSLRVGEDIICSQPACALLGFYRAGMLFRPVATNSSFAPYAYGHLAYFLHGAEPLDGQARPYNVGLHWGAGAGVEIALGRRIGMYVEAGALGDVGGGFIAPTAAAGVLVRFGRPATSSVGTAN